MAKTLSALEFESTINSILAEYKDAVNADVVKVTERVAKQAVANVKAKAPVRTGEYRKSIKKRPIVKAENYAKTVVYADAPHYRLTHLLEFGHQKLNGGRTNAYPHWEDAEMQAIRDFEKQLREAIE